MFPLKSFDNILNPCFEGFQALGLLMNLSIFIGTNVSKRPNSKKKLRFLNSFFLLGLEK